jgi:hypothetical protein
LISPELLRFSSYRFSSFIPFCQLFTRFFLVRILFSCNNYIPFLVSIPCSRQVLLLLILWNILLGFFQLFIFLLLHCSRNKKLQRLADSLENETLTNTCFPSSSFFFVIFLFFVLPFSLQQDQQMLLSSSFLSFFSLSFFSPLLLLFCLQPSLVFSQNDFFVQSFSTLGCQSTEGQRGDYSSANGQMFLNNGRIHSKTNDPNHFLPLSFSSSFSDADPSSLASGIIQDFKTGSIYLLADSSSRPVTFNGQLIARLLVLDPITAFPTGSFVSLSSPIPLNNPTPGDIFLASGYGQVLLLRTTTSTTHYAIDFITGTVTPITLETTSFDFTHCSTAPFSYGILEGLIGNFTVVGWAPASGFSTGLIRFDPYSNSTIASFPTVLINNVCSVTLLLSNNTWWFPVPSTMDFGGTLYPLHAGLANSGTLTYSLIGDDLFITSFGTTGGGVYIETYNRYGTLTAPLFISSANVFNQHKKGLASFDHDITVYNNPLSLVGFYPRYERLTFRFSSNSPSSHTHPSLDLVL